MELLHKPHTFLHSFSPSTFSTFLPQNYTKLKLVHWSIVCLLFSTFIFNSCTWNTKEYYKCLRLVDGPSNNILIIQALELISYVHKLVICVYTSFTFYKPVRHTHWIIIETEWEIKECFCFGGRIPVLLSLFG